MKTRGNGSPRGMNFSNINSDTELKHAGKNSIFSSGLFNVRNRGDVTLYDKSLRGADFLSNQTDRTSFFGVKN